MKLSKIILATLSLVSASVFAQEKTWEVDPAHASIVFKVNHLQFSNVYGMLPGLEGKLVLDDAKPEKASFELKAKMDKLTTLQADRDKHLMGPDFFNVKQFPAIELKSKSVKKSGDKYDVAAELTMHGVTKPVSFVFHRMKTGKDPWGNTRTGGETTFKIKRTDFGVSYMSKPGEISDEVEITVSLEAKQK